MPVVSGSDTAQKNNLEIVLYLMELLCVRESVPIHEVAFLLNVPMPPLPPSNSSPVATSPYFVANLQPDVKPANHLDIAHFLKMNQSIFATDGARVFLKSAAASSMAAPSSPAAPAGSNTAVRSAGDHLTRSGSFTETSLNNSSVAAAAAAAASILQKNAAVAAPPIPSHRQNLSVFHSGSQIGGVPTGLFAAAAVPKRHSYCDVMVANGASGAADFRLDAMLAANLMPVNGGDGGGGVSESITITDSLSSAGCAIPLSLLISITQIVDQLLVSSSTSKSMPPPVSISQLPANLQVPLTYRKSVAQLLPTRIFHFGGVTASPSCPSSTASSSRMISLAGVSSIACMRVYEDAVFSQLNGITTNHKQTTAKDNQSASTMAILTQQPIALANYRAPIYHLTKLWGIIDLGNHEHVFFDRSILLSPSSAASATPHTNTSSAGASASLSSSSSTSTSSLSLLQLFAIGQQVEFHAVRAHFKSRAKWRATQVWPHLTVNEASLQLEEKTVLTSSTPTNQNRAVEDRESQNALQSTDQTMDRDAHKIHNSKISSNKSFMTASQPHPFSSKQIQSLIAAVTSSSPSLPSSTTASTFSFVSTSAALHHQQKVNQVNNTVNSHNNTNSNSINNNIANKTEHNYEVDGSRDDEADRLTENFRLTRQMLQLKCAEDFYEFSSNGSFSSKSSVKNDGGGGDGEERRRTRGEGRELDEEHLENGAKSSVNLEFKEDIFLEHKIGNEAEEHDEDDDEEHDTTMHNVPSIASSDRRTSNATSRRHSSTTVNAALPHFSPTHSASHSHSSQQKSSNTTHSNSSSKKRGGGCNPTRNASTDTKCVELVHSSTSSGCTCTSGSASSMVGVVPRVLLRSIAVQTVSTGDIMATGFYHDDPVTPATPANPATPTTPTTSNTPPLLDDDDC